MADHGRESSREPLTQREREVIHELAREIVKEAGLGRNPDQEAAEKRSKQRERMIAGGRGYWNAQVDIFKHMATVSAATVVGVPVVLGAFVPDPKPAWLLYASALVFFFAVLSSIASLLDASDRLALFSLVADVSLILSPTGGEPDHDSEEVRNRLSKELVKLFSEEVRDPFRLMRLRAFGAYVIALLMFGILLVINVI